MTPSTEQSYWENRRSPHYVRDMESRTIHALYAKFAREFAVSEPSEAQLWLWDALQSELWFRWRRAESPLLRCHCEYCWPPPCAHAALTPADFSEPCFAWDD